MATANLGITLPTVGGSTDTWGTTLNTGITAIDALFSVSGTDVTMSDIKFNSIGVQETGAGTDAVKIQAPSAVTAYTLTMPGAVPSANQVLSASDGSGTLAWTSPEVGDITSVADATNGGMTVTNGTGPDVTLGLNFNDLSAAAVNVANDSIAIIDADDSSTKKESIADLATAMGGTGLTGASGTLAVDASQTQITAVGTLATGTWSADTVAVNKGGTGATSLTDGGILLGSGVGAITATSVLGDGEILIGDGTTDPVALDVGSSTAITILGTVATGTWQGTPLATAYIADNAVTLAKLEDGTSGDILYYAASGVPTRLAKGSDTEVLTLSSGLPVWVAPTTGDLTAIVAGAGLTGTSLGGPIPTLNVIGTADKITVSADAVTIASTYVGQTSVTTLGTVGTGTWSATAIAANKGGTAITSYAVGDILYASGTATLAKLAKGSDTQVLTLASGVPSWATPTVGDLTAIVAGTGLSGTDLSGPIPTLNVDASQTQITALGTIGTGVWNGTAITGAYIDPTSSPLANTKIWIGSASNVAAEFALSGDATMSAGGAVTVVAAPAGTLTGTTLKSTVVTSSLTAVGTIATGVWNGTKVASAYLDDDTAHLSGTQTFTGAKTFSAALAASSTLAVTGTTTSTGSVSTGNNVELTTSTAAVRLKGSLGVFSAINANGSDVMQFSPAEAGVRLSIASASTTVANALIASSTLAVTGKATVGQVLGLRAATSTWNSGFVAVEATGVGQGAVCIQTTYAGEVSLLANAYVDAAGAWKAKNGSGSNNAIRAAIQNDGGSTIYTVGRATGLTADDTITWTEKFGVTTTGISTSGTLGVTGATTLSSTLAVTGTSTFTGTLTAAGGLRAGLNDSLNSSTNRIQFLSASSTLRAQIQANRVALGDLWVLTQNNQPFTVSTGSGLITLDGATSAGSTLAVTGATTLSSTLAVTGAITTQGKGGIKGQFQTTMSGTTVVSPASDYGTLSIVSGNDGGNMFTDLVFWTQAGGATVLDTKAISGGPTARTYSVVLSRLNVAGPGGTVTVNSFQGMV